MEEAQLKLNEDGSGTFYLLQDGRQTGEMVISIKQKVLTVYHTEVAKEAEGKGLAKKLLSEMVSYARKNMLKVIALCPFVHSQFRRHPEEYADVWLKTQEGTTT